MHGFFAPVFRLLFPDDCRICGQALREISRVPVCAACLKEPQPLVAEFACSSCRTPFVNHFPLDEDGQCALCRLGLTGFDAVYSYGSYEAGLRTLIHLFKFEKVPTLAKPLGSLMARVLPREQQFDCVVPMPLHWRRQWQRGFNQSELLANEIARRCNAPVRRVIRRVKPTPPQSGLTHAKRRANVRGAFALQRGPFSGTPDLKGQRILLIDDVLTTGATAAAAARVLKKAGAKHVVLLTVARTDRRLNVIASSFQQVHSTPAMSAQAQSAAGGTR